VAPILTQAGNYFQLRPWGPSGGPDRPETALPIPDQDSNSGPGDSSIG